MKKLIPVLTVFVFVAFSSTALKAQSSDNANITASANILGAISVTSDTDLDFGTFTDGESSTIDITTDTPGKFLVTASGSGDISLSFTLPGGCAAYTYCLERSSTPGDLTTDELELTFAANDAGWDNDDTITNNPTATFDPTTGLNSLTTHDGDFAVFVGGTADASAGQASDTYSGDITLTVAYN